MTHGRAEIQNLLSRNTLRPSRALGQNFVADANTVRRIVRLAGVTQDSKVVEIGAGLGSLTMALAETGATVVAVEVDHHILPVLRAEVEPLGVEVVDADATTLDWQTLVRRTDDGGLGDGARPAEGRDAVSAPGGTAVPDGSVDPSWSVVANLPYNVAVPVVVRMLEEAPMVSSMLVMVQREVGERLAAGVGDDAYGAVSVKVAYWSQATVVGTVPQSVFVPRPRVESALVRLVRRSAPGSEEGRPGPGSPTYERLFAVVRAGFAHRRKMLRRSLAGVVDPAAFVPSGVEPTARAEELDLDDWRRLAAWCP